jgi:hypothetical protein
MQAPIKFTRMPKVAVPPMLTKPVGKPELPNTAVTHVDDWIDTPTLPRAAEKDPGMVYAKFFLLLARLPAHMQWSFHPWISQFQLFCTYKGERFRVTGASRMGDIWLVKDHLRNTGYDHRVMLDDCSNWSKGP